MINYEIVRALTKTGRGIDIIQYICVKLQAYGYGDIVFNRQ